MILVLSSMNRHKKVEIKEKLNKSGLDIEIKTADEVGFKEDIKENGLTFKDNAKIKVDTPDHIAFVNPLIVPFCLKNQTDKYYLLDFIKFLSNMMHILKFCF